MGALHWVGGIFMLVSTAVPLVYKRKDRRKKNMDAWTQNNDGINLPSTMDASEHSGAVEPAMELCEHKTVAVDCDMCKCGHDAGFTDGELPGGRKIKHCRLCGWWKDAVEHIGVAIGEEKFGGGGN